MATTGSTLRGAAGSARDWQRRRADKRALARFGEFWTALQHVGDVLAEAEKLAKNADDTAWVKRNTRHWNIATTDEVKTAVKGCRSSLRIMSAQAKRFEPELILKDWKR